MKYFRIFILILFMATTSVLFQNCGEAGSTEGLLSDPNGGVDDDGCFFGEDCDLDSNSNADASFMELEILNPDPTYVKAGDQVLSVSGACNDGDFDQNRIDWVIKNDSGTLLYEGSIPNACVKNDFQLIIPLLNSFNPAYPHQLELELVSLDKSGEEHRSPLNAVQSIRIAPDTN